MPLELNGGDYNMPTLAGLVSDLIAGHTMPLDLYAYGLGGDNAPEIYVDRQIGDSKKIVAFLSDKGLPVVWGLPNDPHIRPAVALNRAAREPNFIHQSARVIAFLLFCMHETILLSEDLLQDAYVGVDLDNHNPNEGDDL